MFSNIIPAAGFTVATTSPALLGQALNVLHFFGRHPFALAGPLTVAAVLLVAWSFHREAVRQRAINAADDEWSATGRPVEGWGPGWVWSGWTPREAEDQAEDDQAEEVPPAAAEVEVCASCHLQPASVTITYTGGPTFAVCSGCSPVATVLGRAS